MSALSESEQSGILSQGKADRFGGRDAVSENKTCFRLGEGLL